MGEMEGVWGPRLPGPGLLALVAAESAGPERVVFV